MSRQNVEDIARVLGFLEPNSRKKIRTTIGIETIEEDDIGRFFAEVGDVASLSDLWLSVESGGAAGPSRTAVVSLGDNRVTVSVDGEDETWVRGRFDALLARLKAVQSRGAVEPSTAYLVLGAAVVILSLAFSGTTGKADSLPLALVMASASQLPAVLVTVAVALALAAVAGARARSAVVLKRRSWEWLTHANTAILTACAVAAVVVAFGTWKYPVK